MDISPLAPNSPDELAGILREASANSRTVKLIGNNSKRFMAGPILPADVVVSTSALCRVLQYEPSDLTISVEAGMPFADLQALLAQRRQMIALDPPFWSQATIGGVVASNSSGPMRRAYGTARDLVIGMSFATLEGKIINTGGIVVKNVAGLDMGKVMIGSFGTLAAMTSLNFRVHSLPSETQTFLFPFGNLESAIHKRDSIIQSVLQPVSIDLISPAAAVSLGHHGFLLAVRAGGSRTVLEKYARDLNGSEELNSSEESEFWQNIREFTPDFIARQPAGVVLRVSTTLKGIYPLMQLASNPSISRAASGVTYVYLSSWKDVAPFWSSATENSWSTVVEFAPDEVRRTSELWSFPGSTAKLEAFAMMKRVKQMFDPESLLNCSRLYGRI